MVMDGTSHIVCFGAIHEALEQEIFQKSHIENNHLINNTKSGDTGELPLCKIISLRSTACRHSCHDNGSVIGHAPTPHNVILFGQHSKGRVSLLIQRQLTCFPDELFC